jgi:TonB family protein
VKKMIISRRLSFVAIPIFLMCSLASAQTGSDAQAAKLENFANQALPKPFACPSPSSLGEVSLRISVDTKGNVSEVKALNGPEKLMPAAEACAKTWKFENPPSAPVTKPVALRYELRDCPPAESQRGDLQYSWGLRDSTNLVVAYVEGGEPPTPPYPEEERKAGKVGKMLLSVSLNADGTVKEVHVLQGLSPRMDKTVMDQLRALKFKAIHGISEAQLQGLLFQIIFHATCSVPIAYNVD